VRSVAGALALLCMLVTLPGTVELAVLSLAALVARWWPPRRASGGACGTIAVVVPAHNEEGTIGACVRALQGAIEADGQAVLVVVADRCSDATAEVATALGARVLVRDDTGQRGKGFALRDAWQVLRLEPIDALAVVDADAVVDRNFVLEVRRHLQGDADAVQVRNLVANANASVRTRLLALAMLAMNVVRTLGRERLGCSVGLFGNGFAVRREALEQVPFSGGSITEDLEYHLRLVHAGRRARFVDSTTVWAEAATHSRESVSQRIRWEGGRLHLVRTWLPRLARGVGAGRLRLVEPLLDLLTLPLAYHAALLALLVALPWTAGRIWGAFGLAVLALHLALAARIGGRLADLTVLVAAPAYLLWKLALLGRIVASSRTGAAWNRATRRHDPSSRSGPS
jgi:cellulose synthase/poly-beta-1,6-N-acetylglucosamine synthase-like glycosyltransferase